MSRLRTCLSKLSMPILAAGTAMVLIGGGNGSAAPVAGTKITNVAVATYFNPTLGIVESISSNAVEATVLPVANINVVGGETKRLVRSVESSYSFRVENTGNTSVGISATISELGAGDDFDVTGTLYVDTNRNGVIDPTEQVMAPDSRITLPASGTVSLIYMFNTPNSVSQDDSAISVLHVVGTPTDFVQQPIVVERQSVALIDELFLRIDKSASYRLAANQIDYRLSLRNNGELDIEPYNQVNGSPILIDGVNQPVVLVRDAIPLRTQLVSVGDTATYTPVYHIEGDDEHSYVSTLPTDLATVDAIAFYREEALSVGRSDDLNFSVQIAEQAGAGNIINQAVAYVDSSGTQVETPSNEVLTPINSPDGVLSFFDEDFTTEFGFAPFDFSTGLQIVAGSCNATRDVDLVQIVLTTQGSNDRETLIAKETGGNTGIFRTIPLEIVNQPNGIPENRKVEGRENEVISATASCDGVQMSDILLVSPGGFVFDAITNEPISNASVRLIDSVGMVVGEARTSSTGYYDLGLLPPCNCRLEVVPPNGYEFPSEFTVFAGFNRGVSPSQSYGGSFNFSGGALTGVDVPLDPNFSLPLTLDKTANQTEVRRGDYVSYELTANNQMNIGVNNAVIEDTLPPGFIYVAGTAKIDGVQSPEPEGAPGSKLLFSVGTISPNSSVSVSYVVRVAATAGQGEKVNRAIMRAEKVRTFAQIETPTARAIVKVDDSGGVFSEDASVIGKVFLDKNENGVQDDDLPEELGIPGVKIVTSNGLSVVTDSEGRYSLFGLRPRTTVFSLRPGTLPFGSEIMLTEIDDVLRPGTRLIDLRKAELRSEDFPIVHTDALERLVKERREGFEELDVDESLLRDDLPLTFSGGSTRLSARRETAIDTSTDIVDGEYGAQNTTQPAPEKVAEERFEGKEERQKRLSELLPTLTNDFDIVGLDDEFIAYRPSVDVILKSPAEATLQLYVNDMQVPGTQIGTKLIDRSSSVQLFEYIAVPLVSGKNVIAATLTDPFGNERGRVERVVYAPGKPDRLQIEAPKEAPSDSRSRIPVTVRVLDAEGLPVQAPAEITLDAERGRWDVRDIRDQKPGIQAFIDNGHATFDFIPPDLVGSTVVKATADFGQGEATILISPNLEDRIFVGIVEGAMSFGENGTRLADIIEDDEISVFEDTTEGVRGQLYLKGKVLGDSLLTLRYDSDQDTQERLFRDIARDEYYPVYGDSSERGFDAQSSSQLFVKVERKQSYILYGDIAIEPESQAVKLGAYRRSLTGVKAHIEQGPVSVTLFAAETEQGQRIVELPGRGISGPYDVALDGLVEGSEIVEIITRDRDQPAIIIATESQRRLTDYSLDFFSGALIFNRPVPQIDDNLNPVSIRVTYETEVSKGDSYYVYGGEITYRPSDRFAVGYRHVHSEAARTSSDRIRVRGAYVEADFGEYGAGDLELTQSEDQDGVRGHGVRGSYNVKSGTMSIRADASKTTTDFAVPGSSISGGRDEVRLRAQDEVTERITGSADILYTRDAESGEKRYGTESKLTYAVNPQLDLTAGVRAVTTRRDAVTEDDDVISGIVGVAYRPAQIQGLALNAEYEQDVLEAGNWRLQLGGDYQYNPNLRFYALNEISTTESGFFGIGDNDNTNFTTKFGAEYRVSENIDGYSEYRDGGAGDAGVANGWNATWTINEHTTLRSAVEHVEPVQSGQERSSSISLGGEYAIPAEGLLMRADAEWNRTDDRNTYFGNLAFGYKYNDSVTLLFRNRIAYEDGNNVDRLRDRLRFGVSYRPLTDTRHRLLGWYEYEIDRNVVTDQSHRWSLGGTYTQNDQVRFNYRYAGKYTEFQSEDVRDSNTLHMGLIGTELEVIDDRLALEGNVALFTDSEFDNYTLGLGAEAKLNVTEQFQVGLGYNHVDLEEDQVRDLYFSGWYLRGRIKLDDSVWDAFDDGYQSVVGAGAASE